MTLRPEATDVYVAIEQSDLKATWSPNLHLSSTEDIPKRLREPEGSEHVRLAKGRESLETRNCEEYLKAVSAGFAPATNYDNKMSFEFVHDCFVLRDLEHARAARSSAHYSFTATKPTVAARLQ